MPDTMIARGPTLTDDGQTATGSMHIVDLPNAAAARVFALRRTQLPGRCERRGPGAPPAQRAGPHHVGLRRDEANNQRFPIIGHAGPGTTAARDGLLEQHRCYFVDQRYQDRFIARGPLLTDDGSDWVGSTAELS